jgi:hypothetical protein
MEIKKKEKFSITKVTKKFQEKGNFHVRIPKTLLKINNYSLEKMLRFSGSPNRCIHDYNESIIFFN